LYRKTRKKSSFLYAHEKKGKNRKKKWQYSIDKPFFYGIILWLRTHERNFLFRRKHSARIYRRFHGQKLGKGDYRMKKIVKRFLRAIKLDVLLLGLLEKIVLGLIKKITSVQIAARTLLDELAFCGETAV
jgi:hypothetical protein